MQLTSKGQVTIPKKYRDKLGFHEGVEVDFIEEANSLKLVKTSKSKSPADRLYGILKNKKTSDELVEEMRGR